MHVATQLFVDAFEIGIDGRSGTPDDVFHNWDKADRFGIVVDQPLGGLGASLLLQLAIAKFYDVDPARRTSVPSYPEAYLFHVGGPHGDYSNFDIWPPRKEVFLPDSEPLALLEAINDRAITRLALPAGRSGDAAVLGRGPNTWVEAASARQRIRSVHLYSPNGNLQPHDLTLASRDPRTKENIRDTLDMTVSPPARNPNPPNEEYVINEERWIQIVKDRQEAEGLVDPTVTKAQRDLFRPGTEKLTQAFRSVELDEALGRLAALGT